jgi:hypothetical protein
MPAVASYDKLSLATQVNKWLPRDVDEQAMEVLA